MVRKIKIVLMLAVIVFILFEIVTNMGDKIHHQEWLRTAQQMAKLDAAIRESGVDICYVQPLNSSKNTFLGMIHFWDEDDKVLSKFSDIKSKIYEYTRLARKSENQGFQVIKYVDDEGFNLEDSLNAKIDLNVDETQADYYDVVKKYTGILNEKLKEEFDKEIEPSRYHMKIMADVNYDVTLNAYSPKKLFFFVRFSGASIEQMQKIRIIYKKISGFKEERGDKIYFYNEDPGEFKSVEILRSMMVRDKMKGISQDRTVFYDPIGGF